MTRFFIFLWIVAASLNAGLPQKLWAQGERTFTVAELNCENLFDTIHAAGKNDIEYTPQGYRQWNTLRYHRKLDLLAREIVSLDMPRLPDVVALLEVENDTVLRDLTTQSTLSAVGYRRLIAHGADRRGINTALIYLEGSFRPISVRQLLDKDEQRALLLATRSILCVQGVCRSGDTLNILVVHAPSKLGGMAAQRNRALVFNALRHYTDSLLSRPPYPNIIIMGDFNEAPSAPSLCQQLGTLPPTSNPIPDQLYNLALHPRSLNGALGSYRFQGNWQMLDQCILSGTLLKGDRLYADSSSLIVIDHPFLMEADSQYGGVKPWRTFMGNQYLGGFSDHLPILLRLYYH